MFQSIDEKVIKKKKITKDVENQKFQRKKQKINKQLTFAQLFFAVNSLDFEYIVGSIQLFAHSSNQPKTKQNPKRKMKTRYYSIYIAKRFFD